MRWTAASLCTACVATALFLAHATFGEQPSGDSPAAGETAAPDDLGEAVGAKEEPDGNVPDAMIDEIRRIRRRLDIDPLEGSFFESTSETTEISPSEGTSVNDQATTPPTDDDAEFADMLRKLAPRFAERPNSANQVFYQGDTPASPPPPSLSERQFLTSLQTAARQLAWRAEVLEGRHEYAAADRLRRLAAKLRRETRRLVP